MKPYPLILAALLLAITLLGCSSNSESYQQMTPEFRLEQFFDGKLEAHGMVQQRSGAITRRFRAELMGSWQVEQGKLQGVLDEQFYWDDGEVSERIWYLSVNDDGSYSGTAADVIGSATGTVSGSVLTWQYQLQLPPNQGGWKLTFDDTMVLIDEQQLLNIAIMKKWGFEVGRVTLQIRKLD
ncbi:DUF3833 domain-containing protein [Ferrimonas lipolytica]|uniref:DUF3833 domain-containing protein n=1 Tax=Ferrimonas lipolytica TaxID=2724191 RepID=A0A6H1U9G6_9GAMM|nr:DUF3833 domain-containing protein [Ferrimonas lipolytica]QIZ75681.1 DUF3833 domain-containing protein [Ferrimonas lipolytica]